VMELAERFCDQVGIIHKGKLAAIATSHRYGHRRNFPQMRRWRTCSSASSARKLPMSPN
jgi:ABC-type multidrug transport system ATPase subunit